MVGGTAKNWFEKHKNWFETDKNWLEENKNRSVQIRIGLGRIQIVLEQVSFETEYVWMFYI